MRGRKRGTGAASEAAPDPVVAGVRLVLEALKDVPDADLPPDALELRKAERGDPEPMPPELIAPAIRRFTLEEALWRYGAHLTGCAPVAGQVCTCGWWETRRRVLPRHVATEAAP